MPIPITEEADALLEFERLARPTECPELADDEQLEILAKYKRAAVWSAGVVRQIGSEIIPTSANRNGRRFKAIRYIGVGTDQKNGTTEPVWGTAREGVYTDGNVVWQESGGDWDAVLWDFVGAAREAWLVKKGKAALKTDFQLPSGMSVSASQIQKHCDDMLKNFRPVSVA